MRTKPSILLLVLLSVMPGLACAEDMIVLPPAPPPGVEAKAIAPAQGTQQNSQAGVLPPESITTARPTATAAPQADLIDVVLPAAPEKPPVVDLKPSAPKPTKAKTKKAKATADAEVARVKIEDPFAGVLGTPVSDSQLNTFVFPEAVEGVYFQEGAPLPECPKGVEVSPQDLCKPVFLNGRRVMLLQLRAGAQGLVQMLVHLHSGRIVTLNLAPARGPAAVVRVDGAEDGASDARLAEAKAQAREVAANNSMEATEQDVSLLARFARGDIPGGFEAEPVGKAVRYELFDVIPMASWSNGAGLRAQMLQVRPLGDAPVAVNPGLFRAQGIKALALDRDTITAKSPAILFTLEQLPTEAQ